MATSKSSVQLTAFSAYSKDNGDGFDLHFGATEIKSQKNGQRSLVLGSVPLRSKLTPPGGGLLFLYGHRDTVTELQKRRAEAASLDAKFHFAEISIDVGPIFPGIFDEVTIKTARFANLKRLTAGLQQYILDSFSEYAKEDGVNIDPEGNRIAGIAAHPQYFDRLLTENTYFKKLEVFIIPVMENGIVRQVAYARSKCKILEINQNTDAEIFTVPSGFGKKR